MDHSDLDWAYVLLKDLDRARSLSVTIMLRYNEWGSIVNMTCNPSEYPDYDQAGFRKDYQSTELFRKIVGVECGYDTKGEAIKSFYASELQCVAANRRLTRVRCSLSGPNHYGVSTQLQEFVRVWRQEINSILGSIPNDIIPKFSSGSTYDDRVFLFPMDKMNTRPTITAHASEVLIPLWEKTLWCESLCSERPDRSSPKIIRGNRFTTVPKSAKTDRGICVEPSLNVTYQLGVGRVIRKRLRAAGIDLKHGQNLHRKAVAAASLTRSMATIDLSSASDTISSELVKLVLPPMWYDLLDSLRSKETYIESAWWKNAKFSSMGNGFTFELETLIFYTLCTTIAIHTGCNIKEILTYGDDIIVPSLMAPEVLKGLSYFGFIANERKTWISDVPFRESCGEDYFNGVPVRGHYIEQYPTTPLQWIGLANGIYRMARHDREKHGDLGPYFSAWLRVVQRIPTNFRNFGPVHLGDSVIYNDDPEFWRVRTRNGFHELRATIPQFDSSAYVKLDRAVWSRGSIIAAATLGSLRGQGLIHKRKTDDTWQCYQPKLKKSRIEPDGQAVTWIPFGANNNYPAWICKREFGLN